MRFVHQKLAFSGCLVGLVVSTILTTPAAAFPPLAFDTLQHGEIVTNQFQPSLGLTISANNPNRPFDLAIIFNTQATGTADPDLEGPPWSGGNLPVTTVLGNILILAENNTDVVAPFGVLDDPDDEGNRPAGDLIFDFQTPINTFGFDVVDVEGVMEEDGQVRFYRGATLLQTVDFTEFVTPGPYFDPTIQFGDHTLNRIKPISLAPVVDGFDTGFNRVVVHMGGSGGLDNLVVPEPTVLGGAIVALALLRRSRR